MSDYEKLLERLHEDGLGFGIGPAILCQQARRAIRELQAQLKTANENAFYWQEEFAELATKKTDRIWSEARVDALEEAAKWHLNKLKETVKLLDSSTANVHDEISLIAQRQVHRDAIPAIRALINKEVKWVVYQFEI